MLGTVRMTGSAAAGGTGVTVQEIAHASLADAMNSNASSAKTSA
jgi:hypothetical protein